MGVVDRCLSWGRRVAAWTRREPLGATLLYTCLSCAVLILFVDRPLTLALVEHRDPDIYGFFKTVTDFGLGGPWYVGLAGAVLLCLALSELNHTVVGHELWRARARSWGYAFAVLVASGVLVQALKFAFGRHRPKHLIWEGTYGFEPFSGGNSFPSGHSQVVWAVAAALWFVYPKYRPVYIAAAVVISFSRVAIAQHFLSDIVMGGVLAVLAAIVLKRWFERDGRPSIQLP